MRISGFLTNGGRSFFRALATPLVALALAGCAVGPAYRGPEIGLPAAYQNAQAARSAALAELRWWRGFDDPVLNRLVAAGLQENLTLAEAVERVREARAAARGAGVRLSGDGTAALERQGGNESDEITQARAGLGFSWLIDLFGRARSERQAAIRQFEAVAAEAQAARMLYLSQITLAYVDLRFFQARRALAAADLTSRRRTLGQVRTLFDAGETTQLELAQARALLASSEAEIAGFEAEIEAQRNRIATLLGQPAGALDPWLRPGGQPVPRRIGATGVPADLLRNRPDVRAAERAYAAAVARIGVEMADLFPSIRLNGSIQIAQVSGDSATTWSFGPALRIPVFNRGELQAEVDVAESEARQQYLAWRRSVLVAVEEVETALFSLSRFRRAVAASRRVVDADGRALALARELIQNQEVTLLEVLETERRISDSRAQLAENLRRLARDYIALNVALGAGHAVEGMPQALLVAK